MPLLPMVPGPTNIFLKKYSTKETSLPGHLETQFIHHPAGPHVSATPTEPRGWLGIVVHLLRLKRPSDVIVA